MAFIPIDAKADIEGSKKGKLTPAQHAQLNAWCLASKTGILDCLDKCEAEFSSYTATDNKATVVFKKGYIVICGRLVECEAGTKVEVTTPASGEISGKIILRYSLSAVKEDEFVVETKVGSLIQQDLNDNPLTGVYEFELYSYKATATAVILTRTNTDYVPDIGGKLSQFEKSLTDEGKPLGGYDTSKGTIEERLTALGFKEGNLYLSNGKIVGKIARLGKVEYGYIYDGRTNQIADLSSLTCDEGFVGPKDEIKIRWFGYRGWDASFDDYSTSLITLKRDNNKLIFSVETDQTWDYMIWRNGADVYFAYLID